MSKPICSRGSRGLASMTFSVLTTLLTVRCPNILHPSPRCSSKLAWYPSSLHCSTKLAATSPHPLLRYASLTCVCMCVRACVRVCACVCVLKLTWCLVSNKLAVHRQVLIMPKAIRFQLQGRRWSCKDLWLQTHRLIYANIRLIRAFHP